MELMIGTRRWSTWSMRPWLVLKRLGQPFGETLVTLRQLDTSAQIAPHAPGEQVPILTDGDLVVWDSLAICEYLNDRFPQAGLWPQEPARRALGRSAAAQMHAGFASLRGECPMDLTAEPQTIELTEATAKDVRKLVRLWRHLRGRYAKDGPFLLGDWSIVDAYFTPVAARVRGYEIVLEDHGDDGDCAAYCARLLQQPEFLEWERLAKADS